jgi:hypothetical protein
MIASITTATPAMSHVCTPRGSTPRGTGRRSVTAGGTGSGCALEIEGVSLMTSPTLLQELETFLAE